MIDIKSTVKKARDKYPGYYAGLDDEGIYNALKRRYPNEEWPEISPYELDREVNPSQEFLDAYNELIQRIDADPLLKDVIVNPIDAIINGVKAEGI